MLKDSAERLIKNTQFFLHISAWKLFLAIYGPLILVLIINTVFQKAVYDNAVNFPFNVNYIFSFFYYFSLILMVHSVGVYFLWNTTLFYGLYQKFDNKEAINDQFMRVNLGIILFTVFFLTPLLQIIPNPPKGLQLFYIFTLIYSFFTFLYGLFLIAKMLARVNDPDSTGEESIGIFLMLFFSFVGIFRLQPKIRELFSKKDSSEPKEAELSRTEDQSN